MFKTQSVFHINKERARVIAECARDPFVFCKYLGIIPTHQQAQVLKKVAEEHRKPYSERKKRIAVKSGQGTGKTALAGIFAGWRTIRKVDSMTIVTAPTMKQIKDRWFFEFERNLDKAHPFISSLVEVQATRAVFGSRRKWVVIGETSAKEENAQGAHQESLTYVLDEASGIENKGLIQAVKGTLTNEDSYLFAIGNPNTRRCAFFDFFNREAKEWHLFTFNSEESPIVDRANIERIAREYGVDSDVYRVRVLGEFPLASSDAVFSEEEILACNNIEHFEFCCETDVSDIGMSKYQIGIDVARFGDDDSAIYVRKGTAIIASKVFSNIEPTDLMVFAMELQESLGIQDHEVTYAVDVTGVGSGCIGILYSSGKTVFEAVFGGSAYSSIEYGNMITEAYFWLKEVMNTKTCYIPEDHVLVQELTDRAYEVVDHRGQARITLEKKKKYKDRVGASPDRADAIALAYYFTQK